MVKKRAVKRTKTINYRREIWLEVAKRPDSTKDYICSRVSGSRSIVFAQINKLIDEKVLEYINGKLRISAGDDLEIKRSSLIDQLENFRETRNNTINKIRKIIKNSPAEKRSFFYQQEFKYTKPKEQEWDNAMDEGIKLEQEEIKKIKADGGDPQHSRVTPNYDEGFVTAKIDCINDYAKSWIFMIPELINGLVRSSFSLYASQMLHPKSNETYKEIFEKDIKTAVNEIDKTKKMLFKLMLEFSKNKKYDTKWFHQWWNEITYGLTLEFEPLDSNHYVAYGGSPPMDKSKK